MILGGRSQYTRPFGGEVFGKVVPFPSLDIRYPVAFQGGLEVNLSHPLKRTELRFQRHDKDEARDTLHAVRGFPFLEAAEQGFNDVGRHIVRITIASEQGCLLSEVANHHAPELRESFSSPHESPVDEGDTLHGYLSGESGLLAEREHFAEAGHNLIQFLDQCSVFPNEGVHTTFLGGEGIGGLHHVLRPLGPVEDVHPSGERPHIVGHQVVNVREGVMPGIPDSLGEREKLLVRAVDGLQVCPESVADVPVTLDSCLGKSLHEVAPVVRHGVFRSTACRRRYSVHSFTDIPALVGGCHVYIRHFHIGSGQWLARMFRRSFQGKQDLVLGDGNALVQNKGVCLFGRRSLAAMFVRIKTHLQHPVPNGYVGDLGESEGREYEVHHLHAPLYGAEAASRICVQQCRHLDYFFRVPVSSDMTDAITSAARSSIPASTSFF